MLHPCETLYRIAGNGNTYGTTPGTCRITSKQASGIPFNKWVRDTFTDHAHLKPGDIISNEALFCFDEASELIRNLTGKEKPQRFRSYSHIIAAGKWHILTKANKREIYALITSGSCEIVCLSDSGQRHLFFKHRTGFWQLEDAFIVPDIETLKYLHACFASLLNLGFSQTEIISGNYFGHRIMKSGSENWKHFENQIKPHRGKQIFNFTSWIMYNNQPEP
jgi:hypothetical protein